MRRRRPSRASSASSSWPSSPSWLASSWLPSSSPQSYLLQGFVTRPGPDIPNSGRPPKGLVVCKITLTFLARSARSRSIPLSLRSVDSHVMLNPLHPYLYNDRARLQQCIGQMRENFQKFFRVQANQDTQNGSRLPVAPSLMEEYSAHEMKNQPPMRRARHRWRATHRHEPGPLPMESAA